MADRSAPARLRAAAARAVAAVAGSGTTLDAALASEQTHWSGADAALLAEIVFGTVRWHRRLVFIIERMTGRPVQTLDARVAALVACGLYQLWQMRIPDHAAVAESVSGAAVLGQRRYAKLVNALLRRFQREREALLAASAETPGVRHSHPDWLVRELARDWPDDQARILEANNERAPMWLRVNRAQTGLEAYRERLTGAGRRASTLTGLDDALRLEAPACVGALPGFGDGTVSVQDGAAQLVCEFVDPRPGLRVLDACAAPGGKTAHLLERCAGALDLTALDIDATRLERVRETLSRIGFAARVVEADAAAPADWWDGRPFDRILVDAPCSASGVIRRHPDIKLLRRASDVAGFAERQLAIVERLWPLLAPGGRLVYATCSVLRRENDAVMNDFLARHSNARAERQLPKDNIRALMASTEHGFQILPGTADLDGFYYACVTRQQ